MDLLRLLTFHSAAAPVAERGRIVESAIPGRHNVVCRWCGRYELLAEDKPPEYFGYHKDYGRWWYCPEHSEEISDGSTD